MHTIKNASSSTFPPTFNFLSSSLCHCLSMFPFVFYSLGFLSTFHTYKKNTPAKTSGTSWLFIDPGLYGCEHRFAMTWSLFTCLQVWTYRMGTSCASTLQPFRWFLNSRVNKSLNKVNSIQYPREQGFYTELLPSWTLCLRRPESISDLPNQCNKKEGQPVLSNHQCSF